MFGKLYDIYIDTKFEKITNKSCMIFADLGSEINETQEVTSLMGKTNSSNYSRK